MAQNSEYAIGLGTLALINAGLAQSKGRSGLNWFLLSFVMGPLATLFIVYWSPLEPPSSKKFDLNNFRKG